MKWCRQLVLAALVAAIAVTPAHSRRARRPSRGTVTDSSGGVIPGATVTVTGEAGVTFTAVTNSEGAFNVPGISAGTYKVTVTLQGFKTAIVENVRVVVGNPTNLPVKLELGALTENVKVTSSSELINTQTATVTSTLNADQLNRMPTVVAQRAERGDVPARRQHRDEQPRLDGERSAAVDDQHHARRREQPGQLQQVH